MKNAELIKALRYCKDNPECYSEKAEQCPYDHKWTNSEDCQDLLLADAADALEAAEKRIARLEEDLKTREAEREVMQDTIKICEEAADRYAAQIPKEGEWISDYDGFEYDVHCSVCGEEALIKEGGSHDHAYSRYCPNCGAKMVKGGQDEQIH